MSSSGNKKTFGEVRTALLMIDFQRDFCSAGGYAAQSFGTDWVDPILLPAQRLLERGRGLGWLIVHTREGYAPDLSDLHPSKLHKSQKIGAEIGGAGPLGRFLIRGEYGHDFIDPLAPIDGEVVIDKCSYSAFYNTRLDSILEQNRIDRIVFAGVTADVCVHSTLREAVERGYACVYVKDAISAFDVDIRGCCEKMVEAEGGVWGELAMADDF